MEVVAAQKFEPKFEVLPCVIHYVEGEEEPWQVTSHSGRVTSFGSRNEMYDWIVRDVESALRSALTCCDVCGLHTDDVKFVVWEPDQVALRCVEHCPPEATPLSDYGIDPDWDELIGDKERAKYRARGCTCNWPLPYYWWRPQVSRARLVHEKHCQMRPMDPADDDDFPF